MNYYVGGIAIMDRNKKETSKKVQAEETRLTLKLYTAMNPDKRDNQTPQHVEGCRYIL